MSETVRQPTDQQIGNKYALGRTFSQNAVQSIPGLDQLTEDLQYAYETLRLKQAHHQRRWTYYKGEAQLKWSTQKLKEVFKDVQQGFRENWCGIAVDTVIDRIQLDRVVVTNEDLLSNELSELFEMTGLDMDAEEVHRETLITNESYVIVWKNEEGGEIEAYHNDSRNVHVFYEEDSPRKMRYAAKWWVGVDNLRRMVLYYPDRIVHFVATKTNTEGLLPEFKQELFNLDEEQGSGGTVANPYGEIPVFHFRYDMRESTELDNLIPIQDMLNKTISDMMVVSEFGAFPQRWAVTSAEFENEKMPYAPFTATVFPPSGSGEEATSIGQWDAAPLENYLQVVDHFAQTASIIARIPKHYLIGQSGTPSGEALVAMESPLTMKVRRTIQRYRRTWQNLFRFLAKLNGHEIDLTKINPVFSEVRTIQPLTQAQAYDYRTKAGMPLPTQLRNEGWDEEEIEQLLEDVQIWNAYTKGSSDSSVVTPPPDSGLLPQQEAQQVRAAKDKAAQAVEPGVDSIIGALIQSSGRNITAADIRRALNRG